jgi:hypothetical protein
MGVIMPPMDIPYVAGFPPPVPDEHAVFYIPNGGVTKLLTEADVSQGGNGLNWTTNETSGPVKGG